VTKYVSKECGFNVHHLGSINNEIRPFAVFLHNCIVSYIPHTFYSQSYCYSVHCDTFTLNPVLTGLGKFHRMHYLFMSGLSKGVMYSVSQKKSPPLKFSDIFPKRLGILRPNFTFLSMLDWKFLFNCLQLWWSYAILSATTIMCSKCPPSTETHAWWSHLIWHNFVTVEDNWIKICILV